MCTESYIATVLDGDVTADEFNVRYLNGKHVHAIMALLLSMIRKIIINTSVNHLKLQTVKMAS